ncbi:hypothetical protein BGZ83_001288 [Gryganskiella cystojenkinii]|nr:hypothetical protein BGZ83_001288 [Gryganskiella cystojenkinii]
MYRLRQLQQQQQAMLQGSLASLMTNRGGGGGGGHGGLGTSLGFNFGYQNLENRLAAHFAAGFGTGRDGDVGVAAGSLRGLSGSSFTKRLDGGSPFSRKRSLHGVMRSGVGERSF